MTVQEKFGLMLRFLVGFSLWFFFLFPQGAVCVLLTELQHLCPLVRGSVPLSPGACLSPCPFLARCGTPPPQSIVHPDQLRNARQPVVQEGETRDVRPTVCPHTTPSQGTLWVTSDFFLCQELALPGRDAQAVAFYLSRRMYLPLRSRLLLKWMENQRNEVRIIP